MPALAAADVDERRRDLGETRRLRLLRYVERRLSKMSLDCGRNFNPKRAEPHAAQTDRAAGFRADLQELAAEHAV